MRHAQISLLKVDTVVAVDAPPFGAALTITTVLTIVKSNLWSQWPSFKISVTDKQEFGFKTFKTLKT